MPMITSVVLLLLFIYGICCLYEYTKNKRIKQTVKTLDKNKEIDWKPPKREKSLFDASHFAYDILVIGGGSSGAGCALDAATRGLKVILIESGDFASKTSCKSTKLLHGGIRYLEKAFTSFSIPQLMLVIEALAERYWILQNISYLTYTVKIMVPIYKTYQIPGYWLLLKIYDKIALASSIGRSYFLRREEARRQFYNLRTENLKGGVVYYDGMFNDARTNMMLIATSAYYGATVLNYVKLDSFVKNSDGSIKHAICTDVLTGDSLKIVAKGYISACGPFSDRTRRKASKSLEPIICQSIGTHVVYPAKYGPENMGLLDTKTADGRVMFILPWKGCILAGSTETRVPSAENNDYIENAVDFLHNEIESCLKTEVDKTELLSVWSGIRPLVKDPKIEASESLVRKYSILLESSNFITLTGGKWTTYRKMAEKCINLAVKHFSIAPTSRCLTRYIQVLGNTHYSKDYYHVIAESLNISTEYAKVLLNRYGMRGPVLSSYLQDKPDVISDKYNIRAGEILYIIENEFACTVEDVLVYRLGLAFIDVLEANRLGPDVCNIMAEYFGWSEDQKKLQMDSFRKCMESFGLSLIQKYRNVVAK